LSDLDTLESFGLKVDGILGNSFLKFLLVKIDYHQKPLTLSSNPDNIKSNQGYKVKIFQSSGLISTKLQIGSVGSPSSWLIQRAIIDTGGGDVYLHFPFNCLERVKPELNCQLFKTIGFGSGGLFGESEAMASRLSTMELGGFKVNNVPVKFSNSKRYTSQIPFYLILPLLLTIQNRKCFSYPTEMSHTGQILILLDLPIKKTETVKSKSLVCGKVLRQKKMD